jgi:preprotein translocase subunit SecD
MSGVRRSALQEPSFAGTATISGSFPGVDAEDLVLVLRAGALPVRPEPFQVDLTTPTSSSPADSE